MKAISLKQPWATMIMAGLKKYETRSWTTKHRGQLAIHATRHMTYDQEVLCETEPFRSLIEKAGFKDRRDLPRAAVLGTVELVDIIGTTEHNPDPIERAIGDWRIGRYAWVLTNHKLLPEPIVMRGNLMLWDVPDKVFA